MIRIEFPERLIPFITTWAITITVLAVILTKVNPPAWMWFVSGGVPCFLFGMWFDNIINGGE